MHDSLLLSTQKQITKPEPKTAQAPPEREVAEELEAEQTKSTPPTEEGQTPSKRRPNTIQFMKRKKLLLDALETEKIIVKDHVRRLLSMQYFYCQNQC
jgi:hypothetical protein